MRKLSLVGFVILAAAALVGGSAAITGPGYFVCGPSGSAQIPWSYEGNVPIFIVAGVRVHGQKTTPAPPQPFYRIGFGESRSCAIESPQGTAYFIPAAGEVRTDGANGNALWLKLTSKLTSRLRTLVRKVQPYQAPKKIREVVINDQIASHPASYLNLYTAGTPTRTAPNITNWMLIDLLGGYSPWTDGKNVIGVSTSGDYLKRDGQVVRITASLAKRIRHAQPIPK